MESLLAVKLNGNDVNMRTFPIIIGLTECPFILFVRHGLDQVVYQESYRVESFVRR